MSSGGDEQVTCAACRRAIDSYAKLCPYCGANPATGERIDTQALLQEVFHTRELSTSESVLEYARQRQGIVIALSAIGAFLILALINMWMNNRNDTEVSDAPAVPLTEVTDLANQKDETKPQAMPQLDFQYEGRPQAMRTYIMESGAVTPPEIVAQQQAAQQAAAAARGAQPGAPQPGVPRPGVAPPAQPPRPATTTAPR